eukprot:TRINITY_DN16235_c0_g1_i2.p1 TRINITY_DN16235_c0_g1~~TRINITY_DN16235_c0_g1_i2.p1  ORF type:complete len:396 (+),score=37.92 TRINITY_DN16235_c0_g1_i2:94-1281(+)
MIRRPPRSTLSSSSAASDVYKRQLSPHTRRIWNCKLIQIFPFETMWRALLSNLLKEWERGATREPILWLNHIIKTAMDEFSNIAVTVESVGIVWRILRELLRRPGCSQAALQHLLLIIDTLQQDIKTAGTCDDNPATDFPPISSEGTSLFSPTRGALRLPINCVGGDGDDSGTFVWTLNSTDVDDDQMGRMSDVTFTISQTAAYHLFGWFSSISGVRAMGKDATIFDADQLYPEVITAIAKSVRRNLSDNHHRHPQENSNMDNGEGSSSSSGCFNSILYVRPYTQAPPINYLPTGSILKAHIHGSGDDDDSEEEDLDNYGEPISKTNKHILQYTTTMTMLPSTSRITPVSYTHLRAHETPEHLVCRLLLEKKKNKNIIHRITLPLRFIEIKHYVY